MTTNDTTTDRPSDVTDGPDSASGARAVGAELASLEWTWIAAALAGGALLLSGLRTVRQRRLRGLVQLVAGGALLAAGVVRRRRSQAASHQGTDSSGPESSAEDEGRVQFSTDQTDDLESSPGDESDDGTAEVDISEASMADEPGEAAGPSAGEGQPTTTKAHRSRPTDAEPPDVESDADGEETVQTEAGAEVHTDTNEAGTMDVDEEDVTDESGEAVEDAGVEKVADGDADFSATSGEASDAAGDEPDGGQPDDGESDETVPTEGGAAVDTDTNEAGTMTVDEEVFEETDLDEADLEESDPDDEATEE